MGEDTVLAHTMEAIVGAVYHDKGSKAAREFVAKHVYTYDSPGCEFELEFTEALPDWVGSRVHFHLEPKDGGTLLTYAVEAQIGGKLAQLGQRLVNGAAKKLADDFFQKFAATVSGPGA